MATTGTYIPIGQLTKEMMLDIRIIGFTGWKLRLYIAMMRLKEEAYP